MPWLLSMVPTPIPSQRPASRIGGPGRFQATGPACPDRQALSNCELADRAEVFRLLASAERLELLSLLPASAASPAGKAGRGPLHGSDLEWLGHSLRLPGPVVQEHLDLLLRAGFIAARRGAAGKVHYVRNDDHLSTLSARLGEQAG